MAAAQPVKLKNLTASNYSLDTAAKLPPSLLPVSAAAQLPSSPLSPNKKKKVEDSPSSVVSNLGGLTVGMTGLKL
jgi:hypothetical protein